MLDRNLTNEEKLEAVYEMTLENHRVLVSIHRQQYFATVVRLLYWLVVLGLIGGAYYYARPVLQTFSSNPSKVEETFNQINSIKENLPETKVLNQVLNDMKNSGTTTK